jgi:probable rRNA maturation factor
VSDGAEAGFTSFVADGLELEISVAPAAIALDRSLPHVVAAAIRAANDMAGPKQGSVAVMIQDDESIRVLNGRWRKLDKPTNVLSFPAPDGPAGAGRHIGDIAISYETAAREAAAERKPLGDHITHLSVHGFLHLLGHDHVAEGDAARMEQLERDILARLGVPDPYVAQDARG